MNGTRAAVSRRRPAAARDVRDTLAPSASLAAMRRGIETHLSRALPAANAAPARLHRAMRYATLAPGKRLRPLLALAACTAAGGEWRTALPAAAAVEMIHAYSLVHDDLPAMDDDDFRRGRPTTHRAFDEATAILTGDALQARAFAELARLPVPAPRAVLAVALLAEACGSRELVGGQALDLESEHARATRARVRAIHERKTGALIAVSLALGSLAAGASDATIARFARLGRSLGLAFQIHDDLLNLGSSLRTLGKRGGTDAARGKATWPRAVGAPRARAEAERLFAGAERTIARMGKRGADLRALVRAVRVRER